MEKTLNYSEINKIKIDIYDSLAELYISQYSSEKEGQKFKHSLAMLLSEGEAENFEFVHDFFMKILDASAGDQDPSLIKIQHLSNLLPILVKEGKCTTVDKIVEKCNQLISTLPKDEQKPWKTHVVSMKSMTM